MAVKLRSPNRLFVALDLPDGLKQRLAAIGRALAETHGGRAVPPENLHVTLDFLGNVPSAAAGPLHELLAAALDGPVVPVGIARIVGRPSAARARLVAVELTDPTGAMGACARRVRESTARVVPREGGERAFWPHVTVLRLGRPTDVRRFPAPDDEHVFDIARASLYDSHIAPGGPPRYTQLMEVPLARLAERSSSDG